MAQGPWQVTDYSEHDSEQQPQRLWQVRAQVPRFQPPLAFNNDKK